MSSFYEEVKTQPQKLKELARIYKKEDYSTVRMAAKLILTGKNVFFSGMGTSMFAPQAIVDRVSKQIKGIILEAGELLERPELITSDDVLVLISQSGESIEMEHIVTSLKGKTNMIGITNNPESMLAKSSDITLFLHAGKEESITNKTFTNTLAVLYMLEYEMNGRCLEDLEQILLASASAMEKMLNTRIEEIRRWSSFLEPAQVIHFIAGGGAAMTLANQSALVYMEGARCASRAFSVGSFRHGPIEICSKAHRAVLYLGEEKHREKILKLTGEMVYYGSRVLMVSNQALDYECQFRIGCETEEQFAMEGALFMELMLIEIAKAKGLTAGEFRITQKICKKE